MAYSCLYGASPNLIFVWLIFVVVQMNGDYRWKSTLHLTEMVTWVDHSDVYKEQYTARQCVRKHAVKHVIQG